MYGQCPQLARLDMVGSPVSSDRGTVVSTLGGWTHCRKNWYGLPGRDGCTGVKNLESGRVKTLYLSTMNVLLAGDELIVIGNGCESTVQKKHANLMRPQCTSTMLATPNLHICSGVKADT